MGLEMKYFVLKPRGAGPHADASRKAMRTYAEAIWPHDPELYQSLWDWADREEAGAWIGAQGALAPMNPPGTEPEEEVSR